MNDSKNNKLKWLASFLIIIIFWLFLGTSLINLYANLVYYFDTNSIFFNTLYYNYIGINIPFISILLGAYFCFKYINKINRKEIINCSLIIDYKLLFNTLFFSIGYFFIIILLGNILNLYDLTIVEASLYSRSLFIILALVFTPIQVLAEEILFRGVLIKTLIGDYKALKNRPILYSILFSVAIGLIFIFPHLYNPEVNNNFFSAILYYFIFGSFATFSILVTGGLEIAISIHLANNLLIALFCNYEDSALTSISFFMKTNEITFSKYYDIITLIILFIIIAFINRKKITAYIKQQ